jgi:MGT family glycosyltransferase
MARLYFFNGSQHGHINPTLGLTRALVRRGDEILYFAGSAFRETIERTGATFRAYPTEAPTAASHGVHGFAANLLEESARRLPDLIELGHAERPDAIVFDMHRLWGWQLSRLLGVPAICSSPSFALTEPVLRVLAPEAMRQEFDVEPTGQAAIDRQRYADTADLISRRYAAPSPTPLRAVAMTGMTGDFTLVHTTSTLQPAAHLLDQTIHFVGPSFDGRAHDMTFPFERLLGRRTILVSLGTLFNARIEFFEQCVKAFADSEYVLVLVVGHNVDPRALGDLPDNVILRRFVPQLEVLRHTDVFITHAGMGGVHEALSLGVPMVLYPQMMEQAFVAGQVERLGAGLQVAALGDSAPRRPRFGARSSACCTRRSSGAARSASDASSSPTPASEPRRLYMRISIDASRW